MKVYIVVECGFEHTTVLDVFAKHKDATQLANSHNSTLKQEWAERYKEDEEMLASGPYDEAFVWEREVIEEIV